MLTSNDLLESFTASGVEPFNYRIHSDHRGLYVDLDKTHFFGDVNDIHPKHRRDSNAKHPKSNTKYINQVHKHLLAKEVLIKVEKLIATMNHQLAEQIDQQLIRATQSAAKLFSSQTSAPWSEVLHQSRLNLQILRH